MSSRACLGSVDGKDVSSMNTMFEMSKCLLGPEGTEVALKFKKGESRPPRENCGLFRGIRISCTCLVYVLS